MAMTLKRFFVPISIACSVFLGIGASLAQETTGAAPTSEEVIRRSGVPREAVAAVVNDSVVTTYDVRQRMRLMLISAGGRLPEDALAQLQRQALRDLIEERLKLQETTKYEVPVTEKELNEELTMIAAQSNMRTEDLARVLEAQGISMNSLKEQLKTTIVWPQLVQGRFRERIRVNDDEVEDTLQRMREDASLEQFLISEICIPVDDPSQAQQYYQGALQLIEQMRKGVPFSVIAQQFSACTTAAVGGDMGWVRSGELEPELDAAIRDLPIGAVTNPIPSEGAFMMLAVRDKREAVVAGEPTFKLAYLSAPESVGENTARFAFERVTTADVCSGRDLRIDLGKDIGYTLLENMTLKAIDPRFAEFIEDLDHKETSPVIKVDGAYHAAFVCDKDEGLGLPSRVAIENRIYQRQLQRIGQQYLRDIERKSTVDIRLKEPLALRG
jgi:peptidyl-prolyl cis-trans isomerase SurA